MRVDRVAFVPGPALAARVRATLAAGGVVAIPTESSYGVAVDPRDPRGVAAIYAVKERETGKPLPVVVADRARLAALGVDPDHRLVHLAALVWPAALSVVVPAPALLPAGAGTATLAVRVPGHPGLRRLLQDLDLPLTATSANPSGSPPLVDPAAVAAWLAEAPGAEALVLDAGVLAGGPPSTLLAEVDGRVTLLRPGRVDPTALLRAAAEPGPPRTTPRGTVAGGRSGRRTRASVLALAMLVAPGLPSPVAAATQPALEPGEVVAGQRGYGVSVFSGSEPVRFEAEVVGVVRNLRPGTSYILARLTGQGLEETGVIAGMSGSPVYFDGRLAGAVAFSWEFSQGALALITPIGAMRALAELPDVPPPGPAASRRLFAGDDAGAVAAAQPTAAASRLLAGLAVPETPAVLAPLVELAAARLPAERFDRALEPLRPDPALGGVSGLSWVASGFAPATSRHLGRFVGAVQPTGSSDRAPDPVPGGAVAAVLVDGDFRLAATGTVTERDGERLVAFGHPFLGLGPVRIPLAAAEVVAVIPSLANSFKLSNIGPRIGVVDEDRQAGIRGRLGRTAPTVPVAIRIQRGEESTSYRLELAEVPEVMPGLLGLSLYNTLDTAGHAAGTQELDLLARFDLDELGPLELRQSFDGTDAAFQSVVYLIAFAQFLTQNEFGVVPLAGVELELVQRGVPRAATLVAGHAERSRVRPGEEVGLTLELVPYRGQPFREQLRVTVPADVPDGRYSLLVGDGATLDAVRMQIATAPPVALSQVLALLRSFHSRRELVVLGVFAEPGLAVAGELLPRLPGSLRSLWRAAGSRSAAPLALAVSQLAAREVAVPVDGGVRIDLTVERRRPETGEGRGGDGAGDGGGES